MRGISRMTGMTLVELVIAITILATIVFTGGPILVDMISSLWISQQASDLNQVGRESVRVLARELREAVGEPDSLRPYVGQGGNMLRFYRSENPQDSIRYFFRSEAGDRFLYRTVGTQEATRVPEFAGNMVEFISGSFRVDGAGTGYSNTGKIEFIMNIGNSIGARPESTVIDLEIFCRNFR